MGRGAGQGRPRERRDAGEAGQGPRRGRGRRRAGRGRRWGGEVWRPGVGPGRSADVGQGGGEAPRGIRGQRREPGGAAWGRRGVRREGRPRWGRGWVAWPEARLSGDAAEVTVGGDGTGRGQGASGEL